MRRFQFRLESVLHWRLLQLELEEAKLQRLFEERHGLDRTLEALAAGKTIAERAVLGADGAPGQALAALDEHRGWLARERQRIAARRTDCEARIAAQRQRTIEAERGVRLLERMKHRRLSEWQAEAAREEEALASESYLARFHRP